MCAVRTRRGTAACARGLHAFRERSTAASWWRGLIMRAMWELSCCVVAAEAWYTLQRGSSTIHAWWLEARAMRRGSSVAHPKARRVCAAMADSAKVTALGRSPCGGARAHWVQGARGSALWVATLWRGRRRGGPSRGGRRCPAALAGASRRQRLPCSCTACTRALGRSGMCDGGNRPWRFHPTHRCVTCIASGLCWAVFC